jgi:hypothetical protein
MKYTAVELLKRLKFEIKSMKNCRIRKAEKREAVRICESYVKITHRSHQLSRTEAVSVSPMVLIKSVQLVINQ